MICDVDQKILDTIIDDPIEQIKVLRVHKSGSHFFYKLTTDKYPDVFKYYKTGGGRMAMLKSRSIIALQKSDKNYKELVEFNKFVMEFSYD